jgi:hypothetical protein
MIENKKLARVFGIFFILSFLSYGIGMGLMNITNTPKIIPSEIIAFKTTILVGGILVSFCHTLFNIGLVVIMFVLLQSINRILSYLYLIASLFGTLLLAIGGVFLVLPISISEHIMSASYFDESLFNSLLMLCHKSNFYCYQLGMAIWGIGGLLFCYLLYQLKPIPSVFVFFGCVGYLIFILGTILELFGYSVGVVLSLPGGLFEISLSVWLIVKGFSTTESKKVQCL